MMANNKTFTAEQLEVLDEFVAFLCSDSQVVKPAMLRKRIMYDFHHGEGEAVKLLLGNVDDLVKQGRLSEKNLERLSVIINTSSSHFIMKNL
jgi:hypothetical protein